MSNNSDRDPIDDPATLSQLSVDERRVFAAWMEAMAERFALCTVGFILPNEELPVGSGTLVEVDGRVLIATAAHVLEGVVRSEGRVVLPVGVRNGDGFSVPTREFFTRHGKQRNWKAGEPDLAALEVNPAVLRSFPELRPVSAGTELHLEPLREHDLTAVVGFPLEGSMAESASQPTGVVTFTGARAQVCSAAAHQPDRTGASERNNDRGREPSADLHVRWSPTRALIDARFTSDIQIRASLDPVGASGGGLWHTPWIRYPEIWDAGRHLHLAGIAWFHSPAATCIRSIPIQEWLVLAREFIEETRANSD